MRLYRHFEVAHLLTARTALYETLDMYSHVLPWFLDGIICRYPKNVVHGSVDPMVSNLLIMVLRYYGLFILGYLIV